MSLHEFMRGWPASLVEIAEVIGTGPTLNLVDAFRGLDYCYVPKTVELGHRITQVIGIEAATKLVAEFGGIKLALPDMAVLRARKRLIAEAEGSTSEVALRFGVTSRWVREIRSHRGADPRQIDLFVSPETNKDTNNAGD